MIPVLLHCQCNDFRSCQYGITDECQSQIGSLAFDLSSVMLKVTGVGVGDKGSNMLDGIAAYYNPFKICKNVTHFAVLW